MSRWHGVRSAAFFRGKVACYRDMAGHALDADREGMLATARAFDARASARTERCRRGGRDRRAGSAHRDWRLLMDGAASRKDLLPLVVDITAAYCTRGGLAAADLPGVIAAAFMALDALSTTPAPAPALVPAVTIGESVRPDYLICLEDGRKLKMLRRHLRCAYDMTPAQYRAKWKLRSDYPMVAPNYSTVRSRMAVGWGLGRARNRRGTIEVNADTASDRGAAA